MKDFLKGFGSFAFRLVPLVAVSGAGFFYYYM